MAAVHSLSEFSTKWGSEARALAEQARVLSETKLAQLVRRLQRQTGSPQKECWRFVIKHGIKGEVDHRRWQEEELDEARELLTKYSVEEVAKRLNRSPKALRNALQRRQLSVREIRCDCFSLDPSLMHCTFAALKCAIGLSSAGFRRRSRSKAAEVRPRSRQRHWATPTNIICETC